MVERIREQLNAINRIFIDDKKNRHLHIDVNDSVTLDQILKALEGFELLTDLLSGDQEVTVSSAIPLLRHVHRLCGHDGDDEVITMDIKTTIEPYITENVKEVVETSEQTAKRKRLKKPEKAKILLFLCVAEVLNPRYLGVSTATDEVADNWLPWPELDDVNEEIIRLGMELWAAQNEETEKETQDQEYQAEKPKRKSLASLLLTSTTANSTANSEPQTQTPAQMLRRKLEFYLQLTVHPEINLLQWWKGHMKELPLLSSLARYVLSSCATSVKSERLFSLARHIVSKRRNALKPSFVNMLVCRSFNSNV
ncbi:E3 SUMO-protein ligase ZBED1-like [Watersipora subatra]|uniref:E3 SUMO-protein ligase ZBED1-like n=1 Tax=Watersipora subatra TaxID=2589382 RepID=UPI00355BD416